MLTLSIRVVPIAPLIITSQCALVPEKLSLSVCPLDAKGSITAAPATLVAKHIAAMNIAITFRNFFICLSSLQFNKNIKRFVCASYNKKRKQTSKT
jgi:hypothetical protein